MVAKAKKQSPFSRPEMFSFWVFLFSFTAATAISFYFSIILGYTILILLIVPGAVIFLNISKLIKRDIETYSVSERFKKIISALPDGVIVYDSDFKVAVFNGVAERIFGLNSDEVIGQKMGPEKAQDPKFGILTQTIFPSLAPLVIPRSKPGDFPQVTDISFNEPAVELRVATTPIFTESVTGFIKIIIDRTREVEIYRSKSEFITVAAHQLQTPITTIYWALDVLRKEEGLAAETREVAQEGYLASQNLSKIVNDLLDVARIEEGKFGYIFQEIDIIEFFKELLKNANVAAKNAGVNLYFDPGPEMSLPLNVDPSKLAMAVSNLLDNAIKYNLKNGSVTVRIARLNDKPYVQVSIQDTGVGIPPDGLSKIFKKFFRAENAVKVHTEGTGLGLYIVKNIIKRHGGAISVQSALGRGTTFYFTLPTDPRLIPHKESPYEEE